MSELVPLFTAAPEDISVGITRRDVLRLCFKHFLTVIACLLLVGLATWGALYLQPPLYESSAKVWVQTEQQGTLTFLSSIAAQREIQPMAPLSNKIETEMQLLLARSSVEALVDRLGITQSQLIRPPVEYLKAALPTWLLPVEKKTAAQVRNETIDLFLKSVAVEALRSKTAETTSSVLGVRFQCADRALAPRALQALLDAYVQFGLQHNRELGESTYRLIDGKIQENTAALKSLDDRILALTVTQAARGDVATPTARNPSNRTSSTDTLNATLSSGRTGAPSSLGLLKSETVEMQSKLEEAEELFTADSPNVRHLREQLRALRERLNAGVLSSTEVEVEIERLERLRALGLTRFGELQTKRDQIELYMQLNPLVSDSRLITEAPVEPDKSNLKMKILVGLLGPLAGLFVGLLIAGLREYFDHRLQTPDDVRRYLGLETIGTIPVLKNKP